MSPFFFRCGEVLVGVSWSLTSLALTSRVPGVTAPLSSWLTWLLLSEKPLSDLELELVWPCFTLNFVPMSFKVIPLGEFRLSENGLYGSVGVLFGGALTTNWFRSSVFICSSEMSKMCLSSSESWICLMAFPFCAAACSNIESAKNNYSVSIGWHTITSQYIFVQIRASLSF